MWILNFIAVNPVLCFYIYFVAFWFMFYFVSRIEYMGRAGRFWSLVYISVVSFVTLLIVNSSFNLLGAKLNYA